MRSVIRELNLSIRQKILFGSFLALAVGTSFFSGEWNKWQQALIFVLAFLIIFFSVQARRMHGVLSAASERWYRHPAVYLIAFISIVGLSAFFSERWYNSASQYFLLVSYAVIFFSASLFFREWKRVRLALQAIFWAGCLVAIISLVMYLNQSSSRAMGMLFNANALGSYLLLVLPLGVVLVLESPTMRQRWAYGSGLLVVALSFFLSYSYTGWVAFLVPCLLLIRRYRARIFTRRVVGIAITVAVVAVAVLVFVRYQNSRNFGQAVRLDRVITGSHFIDSFSQRLRFNQAALEIVSDHPWIGTGYNTFQNVYSRYAPTIYEQPRYAHNYYLQTAAETGLFGFLLLVVFLVLLLYRGLGAIRREPDMSRQALRSGLLLALLGSAIHSLFDFGWQFPAVFSLFWFEAGMLDGWSRPAAPEQAPGAEVTSASKAIEAIALIVGVVLLIRGMTISIAQYQFDQAAVFLRDSNLEAMAASYQRSLQFDPDPDVLAKYVGDRIQFPITLSAADYDDLATQLTRYLAHAPNDFLIHWTLGRVYFQSDKFAEAEREYRLAIANNPKYRPDIYYDLAFLYYQEKAYGQAEATITSILNEYPLGVATSNPNLQTQLAFLNSLWGENYQTQGNTAAAIRQYQEALRIKPDFAVAQAKLKQLQP